ncbi:MAG: hypothetical protein ABSF00_04185 [Candidatus Bathyarchaeia archaeon]|jgi:hypothetical protein
MTTYYTDTTYTSAREMQAAINAMDTSVTTIVFIFKGGLADFHLITMPAA